MGGFAGEFLPAEHGLQGWHFGAREGIFLGGVLAQSDAVEEEEENVQG